MGGKVSAEYYRKYRAEHPKYRARERERVRQKRKDHGRGDRSEEYQRRRLRLQERADKGVLLESSLMRKAKQLALRVKKPDMRDRVYDDTYEDLVCVCVLALCEGKDPGAAMKEWMTERVTRTRMRAPLHDWV